MNEPWILYDIDLQLFAEGEKTEKATPKKRQDARKKGQVLQSKELVAALMLVLIFFTAQFTGESIYREITGFMKKAMTVYALDENLLTQGGLANLFYDSLLVFIKSVGPLFAIAVIGGVTASYAQVGFMFSIEALGFKFDRINPISGAKRILSLKGLVELIKAILKILIVCYIVYVYVSAEANNILNIMDMHVMAIAAYITSSALNVAIRICIVLIILGIFDYAYQWWQFEKDLKMSKQEVKEEYKQTEGNPQIKSKIREKQRQISMRRMMQDVPKADVVITNPTHFAVAIMYKPEESDAPKVVAKGQDYLAERIKEVAKENKIQIVENKPLARALFSAVEIGGAIPQDMYQAVAEVLAFVYSLKEKQVAKEFANR